MITDFCFFVCFCFSSDNSASLSALVDMQHQTRILELIIQHAQVLGGVIGGSVETPVEEFCTDTPETSPGDMNFSKSVLFCCHSNIIHCSQLYQYIRAARLHLCDII